MFFILNSYVTSDIVATSMQHHAEVNSNYFNSIDFDIINPDVDAFSQGLVMDIATKPVERCNIVGSTLARTQYDPNMSLTENAKLCCLGLILALF